MRRWLRQYDGFSCGPVALINLDKWRGKPVTNQDLPRYRRRCRCRPKHGTFDTNFAHAVGSRPRHLTYQHFKQHLLSGGVAIISAWLDGGKHLFFVRGVAECNDGRQGFLAVNFIVNETLALLSWQHMASLLRHGRTWIFHEI